METSVKLRFLEEMSLVQEAVAKAFEAEKMNIELLGNGDAHAHWHLFPRRAGDMKSHGLNGRGPVWWVPWEEMAAEDCQVQSPELEEMIKILSHELEKHLA
ncbi:HIT family protein [Streptococcus pneumoniae]|nr:HIT family protein [Streptococcus pneumoniae]